MEAIKPDSESLELINAVVEKVVHKITLPVAMQLIMDILGRMFPDMSEEEIYEMVLFKTDPSLAFPKSDIQNIRFINIADGVRVEVTVSFLSIFGAASPLPTHYNEKVLEDSQNEQVLLDFLDMLNHRLKKLIYPIWIKQRYYVQYRSDLKDGFSKYILSILGLYGHADGIPSNLKLHKLLPFSGILSIQQKSKETLATVLRHYFSHEELTIEEGVVSKAVIPKDQYGALGSSNSTLGSDMSLGMFILTRSLKFAIVFNNTSWKDLSEFAVDGKRREELSSLMRFLQKNPLAYDIRLRVKKDEIRSCIVGLGGGRLGVDTWIGNVEDDQTITLQSG